MALCQRVFGDGVLPLYLPMLGRRRRPSAGLIGLLTQRVFDYSGGRPRRARARTRSTCRLIEEARNALIEGIIAESEDETLMDRYLGGEEIDLEMLIDDLEKAVARGSLLPGRCRVCAADRRRRWHELLELLTAAFPSPLEHALPAVTAAGRRPRGRR